MKKIWLFLFAIFIFFANAPARSVTSRISSAHAKVINKAKVLVPINGMCVKYGTPQISCCSQGSTHLCASITVCAGDHINLSANGQLNPCITWKVNSATGIVVVDNVDPSYNPL